MRQRWRGSIDGLLVGLTAMHGSLMLWNQPTVALEHGGVAYFVAFVVLAIMLGLPMAWFEGCMGSALQSALPAAMRRTSKWSTWMAWWGQGLLLIIGGLVMVTLAWIAVHTGRGFVDWMSGGASHMTVTEGDTFGMTRAPISALILGVAGGVFVILRALHGGLSGVVRLQVYALVSFLILALTALAMMAYDVDARSGMLQVLSFQPEKLWSLETWLSAFRHVLTVVMMGLGLMAMTASFQPRDADVGGKVVVVMMGAIVGQALLLLLVAGITGSSSLTPDDVGGLTASSAPAGFWLPADGAGLGRILGLAALLIHGVAGLIVIALGLRTAWRDESGSFSRAILNRVLMIVSVIAVLAIVAGPWATATMVRGLVWYALPLLAICMGLWAGWRHGLNALKDHIAAYSQVRVFVGWRWMLAVMVPTFGVLTFLWSVKNEPLLQSIEPSINDVSLLLVPSVLVFLLAVLWQSSWGRHMLRFHRTPIVLLSIIVVSALMVNVSLQRFPVKTLLQDITWAGQMSASGQWKPTLHQSEHPVRLAQRAWRLDQLHAAEEALRLVFAAPFKPDVAEELRLWSGELRDECMYELSRFHGDRVGIFKRLLLLRVLRDEEAVQEVESGIVQADWFPIVWMEPLRLSIQALEQGGTGERDVARAIEVCRQWRTLADFIHREADPQWLLAGPPEVAKLTERASAVLSNHIKQLIEQQEDGVLLKQQASWLQVVGVWNQLPVDTRDQWRQLVTSSRVSLLGLGIFMVGLGGCAAVALWVGFLIFSRGRFVDPMAETLENLDPIEVDTGAVTVEGRMTTTAGLGSQVTTPVALD